MPAPKQQKKDLLAREEITHSFCYFPYFIWPIAMFFLAETDKKKTMIHIKYSAIIAFVVIVLHVFVSGSILGFLLFPWYVWLSVWLGVKAYNWDKIQIDFIDSLEDSVQEKIKK